LKSFAEDYITIRKKDTFAEVCISELDKLHVKIGKRDISFSAEAY
jgi:hypothetical protein